MGEGNNRTYVDGQTIYYDQVDTLTWSPLMLERLVEEIGYEMAGRMKIFYCIPILPISNNGLREITDDFDTKRMVTFVDIGYHFLQQSGRAHV